MNEKFKADLERGQEFEKVVLETLNANGYNLIRNPNDRGIDLLEISGGFEVKADHYNFHKKGGDTVSGNAYIEFESYGRPSGIFKQDDYNLNKWVHSLSPTEIIVLDGRKFLRWIAEHIQLCHNNKTLTSKGFRITTGGDGKRTKGLLVPAAEIRRQAERIFAVNESV